MNIVITLAIINIIYIFTAFIYFVYKEKDKSNIGQNIYQLLFFLGFIISIFFNILCGILIYDWNTRKLIEDTCPKYEQIQEPLYRKL
jgi:heme/copper-type cytochrome/quinol oxidase subunit 2